PLSQKSGWTVSGPNTPTLPQFAIKFDPTKFPSTTAAKDKEGSALNRVRIESASPKKLIGSDSPRNVPNDSLDTLSASPRSASCRERITASIIKVWKAVY